MSEFEKGGIGVAYTTVERNREDMSWNPSINFKLRDDQVAFGDLIFDKNGASLVCEVLHSIKDGKPINMEVFKQVLDEWCFTDFEFEKLKEEFEQIKQDIATFKQISTSFGSKWTASIKSVGIAMDYVAGSATWVQKYKENKAIAAGLYQNVKKSGYQFSMAEQQEYDKRYFDVMQASTDTELVEAFLQRQYRENLAAGDKDAVNKYCDALVETGCITPEAAEKKKQMLGYFANASGNFAESDTSKSSGRANSDKFVVVTSDLINEWFDKILELQDKDAVKAESAVEYLYDIMLHVYDKAGVTTAFDKNAVPKNGEETWASARRLMTILTTMSNAALINSAGVTYPSDRVEYMCDYWKGSTSRTENSNRPTGVLVLPSNIQDWYSKVVALDRGGYPAEADSALGILYEIMLTVYKESEIPSNFDTESVIDSKDKAWQYAMRLHSILTMAQNKGLIECADVRVPSEKVNKMEAYYKNLEIFK